MTNTNSEDMIEKEMFKQSKGIMASFNMHQFFGQ